MQTKMWYDRFVDVATDIIGTCNDIPWVPCILASDETHYLSYFRTDTVYGRNHLTLGTVDDGMGHIILNSGTYQFNIRYQIKNGVINNDVVFYMGGHNTGNGISSIFDNLSVTSSLGSPCVSYGSQRIICGELVSTSNVDVIEDFYDSFTAIRDALLDFEFIPFEEREYASEMEWYVKSIFNAAVAHMNDGVSYLFDAGKFTISAPFIEENSTGVYLNMSIQTFDRYAFLCIMLDENEHGQGNLVQHTSGNAGLVIKKHTGATELRFTKDSISNIGTRFDIKEIRNFLGDVVNELKPEAILAP